MGGLFEKQCPKIVDMRQIEAFPIHRWLLSSFPISRAHFRQSHGNSQAPGHLFEAAPVPWDLRWNCAWPMECSRTFCGMF